MRAMFLFPTSEDEDVFRLIWFEPVSCEKLQGQVTPEDKFFN
jgi:hypothetical protein